MRLAQIALLTSKPRQATVKADGPLSVLSLDRKTFKRVMGPMEQILQVSTFMLWAVEPFLISSMPFGCLLSEIWHSTRRLQPAKYNGQIRGEEVEGLWLKSPIGCSWLLVELAGGCCVVSLWCACARLCLVGCEWRPGECGRVQSDFMITVASAAGLVLGPRVYSDFMITAASAVGSGYGRAWSFLVVLVLHVLDLPRPISMHHAHSGPCKLPPVLSMVLLEMHQVLHTPHSLHSTPDSRSRLPCIPGKAVAF